MWMPTVFDYNSSGDVRRRLFVVLGEAIVGTELTNPERALHAVDPGLLVQHLLRLHLGYRCRLVIGWDLERRKSLSSFRAHLFQEVVLRLCRCLNCFSFLYITFKTSGSCQKLQSKSFLVDCCCILFLSNLLAFLDPPKIYTLHFQIIYSEIFNLGLAKH